LKIGFQGLGKLGLPVALAIEAKGHEVVGHEASDDVCQLILKRKLPYQEKQAQEYLDHSNLKLKDLSGLVKSSDIIFVTIQTPHDPNYEGTTRTPMEKMDFDYSYLIKGVKELNAEIEKNKEFKTVVIVSTVLPGTIDREIRPLLSKYCRLCYNPFFIAMGTTIEDFLNPEFVIFGSDDQLAMEQVFEFYKTIHDAPMVKTTIENAELVKVLYNTFISTKLAFANTAMEICHKLDNTDIDIVMNALKLGNDRLISDKYLSGGMSDGGGCHPRDNIAMSFFAEKLSLSFDWFNSIIQQRENQMDWLANLIEEHATDREVVILGKSYKPEINIETGSPSRLLSSILSERKISSLSWDPYIDKEPLKPTLNKKRLYFIATKHPQFKEFPFEKDSIVIDPWRYISDRSNVEFIRVGIGSS
jgi:UDPglucose 6-dehydrogenase